MVADTSEALFWFRVSVEVVPNCNLLGDSSSQSIGYVNMAIIGANYLLLLSAWD